MSKDDIQFIVDNFTREVLFAGYTRCTVCKGDGCVSLTGHKCGFLDCFISSS